MTDKEYIVSFQNHIPARGRKLGVDKFDVVCWCYISKPYPRKGTETSNRGKAYKELFIVFQNHIPARGRKLLFPCFVVCFFIEISKPYPRKGTETISASFLIQTCAFHFKTISPQGDGNRFISRNIFTIFDISKPYPRKGTETCNRRRTAFDTNYFKTISPQGNGAYLQPPLPERGRGTA